jgi:type VI secretion system protein ImpH
VVIGPLTRAQYDRFLPDGSAWRPLNDWIRQYVGHSLRWEIQPVLERQAVPQATLGHQLRLGYTSWAGRKGRAMPDHDCGDLRLRPWSVALGHAGRRTDPTTMRPPQGETS